MYATVNFILFQNVVQMKNGMIVNPVESFVVVILILGYVGQILVYAKDQDVIVSILSSGTPTIPVWMNYSARWNTENVSLNYQNCQTLLLIFVFQINLEINLLL